MTISVMAMANRSETMVNVISTEHCMSGESVKTVIK